MTLAPIAQPVADHAQLGSEFYDPVEPASFTTARLRFFNAPWAGRLGLDTLSEDEKVAHFARFSPFEGSLSRPLALRYHGHQFRVYNPDIGDGRGFLFAQFRDPEDGRLLDLGTKGSGQTPYSRNGDGRLTLKGGIREILATEFLEAHGVYTSKTFALVETGEALTRHDEPSPTRSAVLTRLSHSHIRIGTFQRLAAMGHNDLIELLVDYACARYWPDAQDTVAFYECIIDACARMVAEWLVAGFVHGVLNTDNINITGESFDYGPWRVMDRCKADMVAAYFDHQGLYAFGRQHGAVHWNIARLGETLLPICDETRIRSALDTFPARFQDHLTRQTHARLGLQPHGDAEQAHVLMRAFWAAMQASGPPHQQVFFDLLGGADQARLDASPIGDIYAADPWPPILKGLRALAPAPGLARALEHEVASDGAQTMVIEEVEAIWDAIARDDDWQPLHDKITALRRWGAMTRDLGLLAGPNARPGHEARL